MVFSPKQLFSHISPEKHATVGLICDKPPERAQNLSQRGLEVGLELGDELGVQLGVQLGVWRSKGL